MDTTSQGGAATPSESPAASSALVGGGDSTGVSYRQYQQANEQLLAKAGAGGAGAIAAAQDETFPEFINPSGSKVYQQLIGLDGKPAGTEPIASLSW